MKAKNNFKSEALRLIREGKYQQANEVAMLNGHQIMLKQGNIQIVPYFVEVMSA